MKKVTNDDKGLEMRYFVLKPYGRSEYAIASRQAIKFYANWISDTNMALSRDLFNWMMDIDMANCDEDAKNEVES